jgi:hypothetical protein
MIVASWASGAAVSSARATASGPIIVRNPRFPVTGQSSGPACRIRSSASASGVVSGIACGAGFMIARTVSRPASARDSAVGRCTPSCRASASYTGTGWKRCEMKKAIRFEIISGTMIV